MTTSRIASIVLACGLACAASAQSTQPLPLTQFDAEVDISSGQVSNNGNQVTAVISEVVSVPGADWLRLSFDEVSLAGSKDAGNASYLRITSLEDGHVQYLDHDSIRQWRHTSAYFNGDAVLVEILAYPGTGFNELNITTVTAGTPPTLGESICGTTDDRTLSSDPRSARALPIGCTAWLIDDCEHCFLTAGHCNPNGNSSINVVQFNVPLSDNSCSFGGINHPGPEDQYAVDAASQQTNGGGGVGNDWGYFGAFPNSNTGLLPWQASGSWFTLDFDAPTASSARVTGYGSVSSSLAPCSWYAVQKSHAGPFFSLSGNALGYGMDTTGGNSGSPVIDEDTGNAIGIHTHGGCSSSGGSNAGTWLSHPGVVNALANPQGVCIPQGPLFSFPDGLPDFIDPAGQNVNVNIAANGAIIPDPATAELVYNDGNGAVTIPLTHNGGESYSASLPGGDCFSAIDFSFGVDDTNGESYSNPNGGSFAATIATGTSDIVDLDMNSDPGWTTSASAGTTTGFWQRVVPGDYNRGDPSADSDGSGLCWVTDNAANADIDGGIVTLTTATYDLSSSPDAVLSYDLHHDVTDTAGNDLFRAEISNNGGATWVILEDVPQSTGGWQSRSFNVSDFVTPTSQVVVRFNSQDLGTATIAETAIDAFVIRTILCDDCLADVNGDGSVTPTDFTAWVNAFNNNLPECDQNGDGACTPTDFTAWVNNFNAGC